MFGPPPKEAPFGKLKQHGFARTSRWQQKDSSEGDGFVEVRFGAKAPMLSAAKEADRAPSLALALEPTDEIKDVFPVPFSASYTVRLVHSPQPSLTTSLTVTNPPENAQLEFQALLHTYLRLPSASKPVDVKIVGLKGVSFTDKVQDGKVEEEQRTDVGFEAGEVDRVYKGVPSSLDVVLGHGHSMRLQTSNLPDVRPFSLVSCPHVELIHRTADGVEPAHEKVRRDGGHGEGGMGTVRLRRAGPDVVRQARPGRDLGGQAGPDAVWAQQAIDHPHVE